MNSGADCHAISLKCGIGCDWESVIVLRWFCRILKIFLICYPKV